MLEKIKELLESSEIVNVQLAKILTDSNNLPISQFKPIIEQQISKALRNENIELVCELANNFDCIEIFNKKYGKYWQLIENSTTLETISFTFYTNCLRLRADYQTNEYRPKLENDFFDFVPKRLWINGYTVTQATIDLISEANKNGLFYIEFENCDLSQVTNFDFPNVTYFAMKNVEIDENFSTNFKRLKFLSINNCNLTKIPSWVENCENLETINFSNNLLTDISTDFSKLQNLTEIDLCFNQIKNIPISLDLLPKLVGVKIYGHKISKNRLEELKLKKYVQIFQKIKKSKNES